MAFRGGGYTTCLASLKTAISNRAWEQVSLNDDYIVVMPIEGLNDLPLQVQKPEPEPDRQVPSSRGAGISKF